MCISWELKADLVGFTGSVILVSHVFTLSLETLSPIWIVSFFLSIFYSSPLSPPLAYSFLDLSLWFSSFSLPHTLFNSVAQSSSIKVPALRPPLILLGLPSQTFFSLMNLFLAPRSRVWGSSVPVGA